MNEQAQRGLDDGIMWKWLPIVCAFMLAIYKAVLLLLGEMYDLANLPGDIIYSGLAYDFWAVSQLVARKDIVAGSQSWVIISLLIHLFGYPAAMLLIKLNAETVQQSWLCWSFVAFIVAFALPTHIALGAKFPK